MDTTLEILQQMLEGICCIGHPQSIDNFNDELSNRLCEIFEANNILTKPEELKELEIENKPKKHINRDIRIFKGYSKKNTTYHELINGKPCRITYDDDYCETGMQEMLNIKILEAEVIEPIHDKISTSRYNLTVDIRGRK